MASLTDSPTLHPMNRQSAWWVPLLIALVALVEVSARQDLPSRVAAAVFALAVAVSLGFRRTRPLAATACAFSLATVVTVVRHRLALPEVAPMAAAGILLLPYALGRWAPPRHVGAGAAFVGVTWLTSLLCGELTNVEEAIGSAVVMILPLSIGVGLRFRDEAQGRALTQARLLERAQLARELHDSVAHHLTAITLQAQAASAVLHSSPDDAAKALAAIADESKRTLFELRAIVGALRDDPTLTPAPGLAQLRDLARSSTRPTIDVAFLGDLDGLPAVVERALFRLAQEAVTNAIKHARNASTVTVRVVGEVAQVQLSARDDGEAPSAGRAGFGLTGMAERVALLGGTFEAGPLPGRGWRVEAVLPRHLDQQHGAGR
jgi:signal transduction histidine kinase